MAYHFADIGVYFGPPRDSFGSASIEAFRSAYFLLFLFHSTSLFPFSILCLVFVDILHTPTEILGNFIINNDPSISPTIANGVNSTDPSAPNPASTWPRFTAAQPYQINFNQTGGHVVSEISPVPPLVNVNVYKEPGLRNDFRLVDAYAWEGGRGVRCDFWKGVADMVPF